MKKIFLLFVYLSSSLFGIDTFTPITDPAKLPKNATALWEDYDARTEDLEVEIIQEWKTEEVTTR